MLLNERTMIIGKNISLVPYCSHHVPKYHSWMQDEELLLLTASEPLSIEEEYSMVKSWRVDDDKLTFIAIRSSEVPGTVEEEVGRMVGDVNLFLFDPEVGEINIMVAERNDRRDGFGREILNLMLSYAKQNLKMSMFSAKISRGNIASQKFFLGQGFAVVGECEVFDEIHLELSVEEFKSSESLQLQEYPFSDSST